LLINNVFIPVFLKANRNWCEDSRDRNHEYWNRRRCGSRFDFLWPLFLRQWNSNLVLALRERYRLAVGWFSRCLANDQ